MTPKAKIKTKDPKVLPIPFWMELTIVPKGISFTIPTKKEANSKEIKALNFRTVIKKSNKRILAIKISMDIY
tara:strand:- start:503 stop:718 length:216 start_codon:yes stop_codon:yes gene_type:complete